GSGLSSSRVVRPSSHRRGRGEDRQRRLRSAAEAAARGRAAGVVDPASAPARAAHACADAQGVDRSAHRLAAAAAGAALPPGCAGRVEAAHPHRPGGPREAELSPAGRELVSLALRMIDAIDRELAPLDRQLCSFARRQPGCRALIARLYGVGPVSATAILAELGDCRRFARSDDAVRHSGLDVTVYQSDEKRAPGRLSHEGPGLLRWALFEAALSAARAGSPDHGYYLQLAERIDHNRACLSVARKLCRRAYHILRELGDEALAPVE